MSNRVENPVNSAALLFSVIFGLILSFAGLQPIKAQKQENSQPSALFKRKYSSPEKQAQAKEFMRLLKEVQEQKSTGPFLSSKDIHGLYPSIEFYKINGGSTRKQIFTFDQLASLKKIKDSESPKHRPSDLASPASLIGPLSLGPAYGTMMFQNTLNQMSYWNGPALPWNGVTVSHYMLTSGPLIIPYELAIQNRLTMTTLTDPFGNQTITLYDSATGYSRQYSIVNRLDAFTSRYNSNMYYNTGYYLSTYNGQIIGTNTSSFPGVFIPYPERQTTFGYSGDLDTFGPYGRGSTPLYPSGPPAFPTSAFPVRP